MLHELIRVWFGWVENWGYAGVFLLMAMESSIIPVPSEIVMPPAAFWAAQGRMSLAGVVLAGTAGSYAGSLVSYWVSQWIGLPFIERFGRYFGISHDKLALGHAWVKERGAGGVFLARLLPVIRHLISIPAGCLRMPFGRFSMATILGAGVWCSVLSWFGVQVIGAHPELLQSPEAMAAVIKSKLAWFIGGALVFSGLYVFMLWQRRRVATGAAVGAALISCFMTSARPARADDVYNVMVKKQEEKAKTGWSLSDWLETRDKMRMQDLWLALHSPSPYEFFVGAAYINGNASPGGGYNAWNLSAAAFASIFGLEFSRDTSLTTKLTGMFDLRVFGYHDQGTNITLQAGLRSLDVGGDTARNGLLGVRTDIYVNRFFGLHGLYRHFFDSTPNSGGGILTGNRYEGGAFIDFKFLRVYGQYFSEPESTNFEAPLAINTLGNQGAELGARIYF